MIHREFPASTATAYSIAAALCYAIFTTFQQYWIAALFYILALFSAYSVLGWMVEGVQLMLTTIRENDADMAERETIAHDRNLVLAEQLQRMTAEQLAVYRDLAGAQYDPCDPQSVVLDGFALLTKAFAISYFATCSNTPTLTPIRAYSEGRSDRQREQATELIDWLVTEGYATRAGYNTTASWMGEYSARMATERLGITW